MGIDSFRKLRACFYVWIMGKMLTLKWIGDSYGYNYTQVYNSSDEIRKHNAPEKEDHQIDLIQTVQSSMYEKEIDKKASRFATKENHHSNQQVSETQDTTNIMDEASPKTNTNEQLLGKENRNGQTMMPTVQPQPYDLSVSKHLIDCPIDRENGPNPSYQNTFEGELVHHQIAETKDNGESLFEEDEIVDPSQTIEANYKESNLIDHPNNSTNVVPPLLEKEERLNSLNEMIPNSKLCLYGFVNMETLLCNSCWSGWGNFPYCNTSKCVNGLTRVINRPSGDYICECWHGWIGEYCQYERHSETVMYSPSTLQKKQAPNQVQFSIVPKKDKKGMEPPSKFTNEYPESLPIVVSNPPPLPLRDDLGPGKEQIEYTNPIYSAWSKVEQLLPSLSQPPVVSSDPILVTSNRTGNPSDALAPMSNLTLSNSNSNDTGRPIMDSSSGYSQRNTFKNDTPMNVSENIWPSIFIIVGIILLAILLKRKLGMFFKLFTCCCRKKKRQPDRRVLLYTTATSSPNEKKPFDWDRIAYDPPNKKSHAKASLHLESA